MIIISKNIPNEYIEMKDFYILKVVSEKFGEKEYKIDKDDYHKCKKFHWSVFRAGGEKYNKKTYFYANNKDIGLLHRYIINASRDKVVDHINGDTLDTRKCNLQQCENKENLRKQGLRHTNKSGYKGIIWYKYTSNPKWMAYIKVDGKRKHLGYFDDIEDAIKVRRDAELKYFGEFASNNITTNTP